MRSSIGLFLLALATACGPQKGDASDGGDSTSAATDSATTGDAPPTTGDASTVDAATSDQPTGDTTGDTPPAGACGAAQAGVEDFGLHLTVEPAQGPDNPPMFLEADCTVDARLDSDVQDGLALRCPGDGGEVVLRAEYTANNLPLPASVTVGMAVHVRYSTYDAESYQHAIFVQAIADGRVILAANEGTGIVPFVEGMGMLTEFWGPFAISEVESGCPGMPGVCEDLIQRSGLRFVAADLELELFDHQLGHLGPHGVQVVDVIRGLSNDTSCDGGTDTRQDFLIVHD